MPPSIARVREALAESGLDAVVCLSPANVHYLSGTSFLSQRALRDRPAIVVISPDAEPVFIVMKTEAPQAEAESWIADRRTYMQFVDDPFALLAQILRERGLDSARIGFEDLFLSTRHFLVLRDLAPNVEWVPAETLLDRVRSRKTEHEQTVLINGSLATDQAIADAFIGARVGQSEREIGDHMVELARAQGGGFKHLVLATGKNWSVHHAPGGTKVAPGDLLRVDFGMTWDFYASDLARTAVVAPATPYQLDHLRSLEEIQQLLVQALKPGVRASDIFRLGAKEFERRKLDFHLAHIGHGIGLSIENMFETPVLQPYDDTELVPGMILCLEPSISGRDGLYHMEDLVEITDGGAVVRARARDWSEPLVIAG